ncbi:hypothetical protein DFR70_12430 [Nocardia tenerifensis]|uniref:Uncharacterized protein n=1 Tax=Nocardia tenerifensis TaxID=228006 RepID=A0A318JPD8_9NOCA|nr:hypothetical protein [Nocardia tenerifensis]PXX54589.1 hypothetical protein DFR70_12430 [Nocardia tenerifensis]
MSTAISDITTEIGATGAALVPLADIGELDAHEVEPRDIDSAELDLAFETVPRAHRGMRTRAVDSARRSTVDRRPRGARPGGVAVYDRGARTSTVRRPSGAHPSELVEQAQVGFAVLAVAALLSAFVVAALITLAHLRAGDWGGDAPAGTAPAVVDGQSQPVPEYVLPQGVTAPR